MDIVDNLGKRNIKHTLLFIYLFLSKYCVFILQILVKKNLQSKP